MGTDALLIVIESGKEEERDLDFLLEDAIIASVLSSLSYICSLSSRFSCVWACWEWQVLVTQ